MAEFFENKLIFRDRAPSVYCYSCRKEMNFDGFIYECHICGSTYKEKANA